MAHTAHKTAAQVKEHFDAPEVLEKKIDLLATWVQQSKHCIIFTGAGISTSAGIPDFRGPEGAWTLAAQGKTRTTPTTSVLKAIPTRTHMSIVELVNRGIVKYVVSQNCDGLHRRSGLPPVKLSELHGNTNLEVCEKCKKEYLRDFRTRTSVQVHVHYTGRTCDDPKCKGKLKDSIINFGENLPEKPLKLAFKNAEEADLCIVLGSSLTVSPANDIPEVVGMKKTGKLVIVNLQKTPLDSLNAKDCRIFAKTDQVMEGLMRKLSVDIPPFKLHRRFITVTKNDNVYVRGVDVDGTPSSFIKEVDIDKEHLTKEPFVVPVSKFLGKRAIKLKLTFRGHYGEPTLEVDYTTSEEVLYKMEFNPLEGDWSVTTDKPEAKDVATILMQ